MFDVFFKMLDGDGMLLENVSNMPTVFCCKREQLTKASRVGPMIRRFFIVECNEVGRGGMVINEKEFHFGPGSCYVLLPGDAVVHICDGDQPRGGIYCLLDGPMLAQYFKALGITSETPFLPEEAFPVVRHWLEKMFEDYLLRDAGAMLRQSSNIYGLLGDLMNGRPPLTNTDAVSKAIGIMENDYSERLGVEELADTLGLERTYFSSLFKQKTGYTPHRYLTELRIQKACLLLRGTELPVAQVAEMVGLDGRNFARLFKKEMGKTPLDYKNGRR